MACAVRHRDGHAAVATAFGLDGNQALALCIQKIDFGNALDPSSIPLPGLPWTTWLRSAGAVYQAHRQKRWISRFGNKNNALIAAIKEQIKTRIVVNLSFAWS